jgi:hypothetical protein
MALFPGPKWDALQIAQGLMDVRPIPTLTAPVRTLGAIVMAESLGYVWAHGINHEGSGTPPTSVAYLAEGHGLAGMDDYWIMRTWTAVGVRDEGYRLMIPYWSGAKSFSQLAKDPEWNLSMMWQVYLANAATRGWNEAFNAWTSYKNGRHLQFMGDASVAARAVGAIP